MKKIALQIAFLFASAMSLLAQPIANDSVSLGARYANDIYYSFENGIVGTQVGANWHIAFATRPAAPPTNVLRSTTIIANEGRNVQIYKSNQYNFVGFDTTGYSRTDSTSTWSNHHNSDSSWDLGAFNANLIRSNPFDYGWGAYNMTTHDVEGKGFVYLLRITKTVGQSIVDSAFKLIKIERLAFDTQWVFQMANIDGTDSNQFTISKAGFNGKLFAYFDVVNKQVVNREPSAPWDLYFTRYGAFYTQFGQTVFSTNTGALSYPSILTARVKGTPNDSAKIANAIFNNKITTIGTDWKINPGPGQPNFAIIDSNVYFARLANNKQYRMVFKSFDGSSNGRIRFYKGVETDFVGLLEAKNYQTVAIYPNPASSFVNVQVGAGNHTVVIFDITGKAHLNQTATGTTTIDISSLNKGLYFLQVDGNKAARLLVE
jgi:hypothetical protein